MIEGKKLTYAQFKAKKSRRETTFTLVTDDDAVTAFKLADERLQKAKVRSNAEELAAARKAADAAEAAVRESALVMRLRALPRKGDGSYQALKAEHPPTAEDDKRTQDSSGNEKAKAAWHGDTFGPALVAACLVEPAVTAEQATEMSAELNDSEWNQLFGTAILVNEQATDTAGLVFN